MVDDDVINEKLIRIKEVWVKSGRGLVGMEVDPKCDCRSLG